MLFNTLTYLWFICIVFFTYWIVLGKNFRLQNLFLFVASYCFYGWWDPRFLILIFFSSSIDFFLGRAIFRQEVQAKRKFLLGTCIFLNLGILGFFKYYNFFIDSFSNILGEVGFNVHPSTLKIILPVGVSFYTFQSLSYSIDVFRKKIKPTNDFISFMTFVSFFPQLVAGPIERASHLLPQFLVTRRFDSGQIISGLRFILYGLFKKMVIADRLAYFVDQVYSSPSQHGGIELIVATFLFGFQIYCDFSGYSDIAIGSARLLGFDLMQNFKFPYFSKNFQDFWRRWHISLSTWFRDYVYIPLGGSRVPARKWALNILVTFTISGLWHGAAATFIIWGFLHGLYLVAEKLINKWTKPAKANKWIGFLTTFILINLTWIFFRSGTFSQSMEIIRQLVDLNTDFIGRFAKNYNENNQFREFVTALLFGFPLFFATEILIRDSDFNDKVARLNSVNRWAIYVFFASAILLLGVLNSAPQFIYFQF
jgi:D-alanyl-lipoteichoic acid acyltransferase DltB (MBOAT superfamily)